ncbi:serine protease [Roseovarius sp. D22-M7]|uniref:serine protease n=1 Tax=Roseovarius sp. D22-M7 TaxID=3127116 RepID=UPI0030100662
MQRIVLALICAVLIGVTEARAQNSLGLRALGAQQVWVQIEAKPSLAEAREAARRYAARLPQVNGFTLGNGWYAIALGPFDSDTAELVLREYRGTGRIARDSYIARSSAYRGQFWPVGASTLRDPPAPAAPPTGTEGARAAPDETLREARAREGRLTRADRLELQEALDWAGVYEGAIDAAFGRGTRAAMARWQQANGFEATGVLTTRQRTELLRDYNTVLDGLGLERVVDRATGIAMKLPTEVVDFTRYAPPFAHFDPVGDLDARVLLISQEGDRTTLNGLYDVMQTLEIVPETGPRSLDRDAFTLVGEGALDISHTQVWLRDGAIKGFTLIWPVGDEDRRNRVLQEMQDSFEWLDGTLDPAEGEASAQRLDLVAGLEVRRPRLTRSGFYVDASGAVLTTADAVRDCGRITLDEVHEARVALIDEALSVAVLRPDAPLAPRRVATFQDRMPRLMSDVAVAGYSYGGVLGGPTVTFGQVADLEGLDGEAHMKRLRLAALEGDAGGPVLDTGGSVLGMLLAHRMENRKLPDDVSFAATNGALQDVLTRGGIEARRTSESGSMSTEALTDRANAMTVLVSCWE